MDTNGFYHTDNRYQHRSSSSTAQIPQWPLTQAQSTTLPFTSVDEERYGENTAAVESSGHRHHQHTHPSTIYRQPTPPDSLERRESSAGPSTRHDSDTNGQGPSSGATDTDMIELLDLNRRRSNPSGKTLSSQQQEQQPQPQRVQQIQQYHQQQQRQHDLPSHDPDQASVTRDDSSENVVEALRLVSSSITPSSSLAPLTSEKQPEQVGSSDGPLSGVDNSQYLAPGTASPQEDEALGISVHRLERIRSIVQSFLNDRYSVHEYSVPRLFIVLPQDDYIDSDQSTSSGPPSPPCPSSSASASASSSSSSSSSPLAASTAQSPQRFRLYFLCECSPGFSLPLGSGLNHLHIAKHPGYLLDGDLGRQEEFFEQYGGMVLMLLYFLKYGDDPEKRPSDASSEVSAETAAQQQQHHHQKYRGRQDSKEADSGITRVMGISRLRQSDLPDSIAQDVEDKFNKMIAFLEGLQALAAVTQPSKSERRLQQEEHDSNPDSPSDPNHDEINDPNDLNGSDDFADRLQGLTSLADLHRLYSFIGLANLQTRLQSSQPQLGNLYRISNVRGQVSWVCVYHYRWTFLERNIDEFDRWVVKRRCGYFDKPSGSVSIRLFSRSHARTFCSWISNKVAPSIVEAHIEMGWKFGHKDLERLAKALASSTVTVLSLDGGSFAEKSSSSSFSNSSSPTGAPKAMATATYKMILYTKKYDPILYLLTHGQIHSLELTRFPGMFSKLSKKIVKASSLKRLELGRGMQVESKDRGAFIHFLASCTSLQELILPGCYVSDLLMHAILKGIQHNSNRATFSTSASTGVSLSMLDLSNSQFDDSAAIVLAQGLFNTNISNLDLSKNGMLSDTGAARVIRAVGPRLVSLKMAQTGFGDLAAAALAKSMDGISITTVLRDQLNLQQRLDFVAMAAGHRPGLRIISDNPIFAGHGSDMASPPPAREVRREKTHRTGHLIYLDIEDNQCTIQGFKLLANIKSRLYLIYLNISGSKDLPDRECAQILERVMSSAMVTLRLACTGFGNQSARALAKTLLEPPQRFGHDVRGSKHHPSRLSNLEELDLQACSIGFEGLSVLCDAMKRAQVSACLQIMDLGHCGYLHDQVLQQLVTTLIIPNGTTWIPPIPAVKKGLSRGDLGSRAGSEGGSKRIQMRRASRLEQQEGSESSDKRETREEADQPIFLHARSDTDPTGQVDTPNHGSTVAPYDPNDPTKAMPPRTVMMRPRGFFSNLRHLDLKSTRAGDGTAWLLAQALVQPDAMLTTLMVIDPIAMTVQGMHWIMDALCENTSVEEFGIGKTADVDTLTDLEVFGLGIVNLMELNKRIRSLTLLGAPMGSVAKGLLLNQSLHSLYLIRSRGQFEDLQLMGQALGFTRSLLVFWMDGSEESLLGPLIQQQRQRQGGLEGSSEAEQDDLWATPMVADTIDGSPTTLTSNILQQQYQQHQQLQEEQQHENMYRDFHLFHNQEDPQQQSSQDSRRPHHHRLWQHRRRQDRVKEQQRQHHQVPQHTAWMHSFTNNVGSIFKHAWPSRTSDGRSKERPTAREESRTTAASATIPTMQRSRTISGAAMTTRPGHLDANGRVMTMAAAGYGGGGSWIRHPVIEGVRRNHSLVKVVLDTSISFPLSNTLAESPSNVGGGGGGTITRMSSRNAVSQQYQQQDFVPPQDLQQFQTQQQQLLQNKIVTNRKLLRERARVGWEELKLAGIDDDIIQEVLDTDIA